MLNLFTSSYFLSGNYNPGVFCYISESGLGMIIIAYIVWAQDAFWNRKKINKNTKKLENTLALVCAGKVIFKKLYVKWYILLMAAHLI